MAVLALMYGVFCYGVFLVTFLYAIAFLGNVGVTRTVDFGGLTNSPTVALTINLGLLGLFAVQHSVMARQGFKKLWTRIVPSPVERSTYVLLSSLALILLYWQWRPIPTLVWDVQAPVGRGILWSLFALGWFVVLLSTFLINHFELFGLNQVWRYLRKQISTPVKFREPLLYKYVRHPLYVGWLLAFWAIPTMTVSHLVFAIVSTTYILMAIRFEERDLKSLHPEYAEYSARVPMLIPRVGRQLTWRFAPLRPNHKSTNDGIG